LSSKSMQRLVYLCTGSSRLFQVVGVNHLKNNKLLFEKQNSILNTNNLILKRCLATKNKDSKKTNQIDVHADLYKASTTKQETHVPDALKGHHQAPETFQTNVKGAKVWSPQNLDDVHVAPLGRVKATTFVPKSTEGGPAAHETTVYTTQGELNIADPFKTHTLQHESTPVELAEAAAVSAFDTFAPDDPLTSSTNETVFSPKISSAEVYSTTSSPTSEFDSGVPTSSHHDTSKYETSHKSKIFGGQDTSADSKKPSKRKIYRRTP